MFYVDMQNITPNYHNNFRNVEQYFGLCWYYIIQFGSLGLLGLHITSDNTIPLKTAKEREVFAFILFIVSILYNWVIVYKRQNFLKIHVVVHVIIIDQCNQTAR